MTRVFCFTLLGLFGVSIATTAEAGLFRGPKKTPTQKFLANVSGNSFLMGADAAKVLNRSPALHRLYNRTYAASMKGYGAFKYFLPARRYMVSSAHQQAQITVLQQAKLGSQRSLISLSTLRLLDRAPTVSAPRKPPAPRLRTWLR
jgi:hypothetical protein